MLVEIHDDKNNLQLDKHVASARKDYINSEGDEFFLNHKCKIFPYIAFMEEKCPCVLTCSGNNGGRKLFVVHPS